MSAEKPKTAKSAKVPETKAGAKTVDATPEPKLSGCERVLEGWLVSCSDVKRFGLAVFFTVDSFSHSHLVNSIQEEKSK